MHVGTFQTSVLAVAIGALSWFVYSAVFAPMNSIQQKNPDRVSYVPGFFQHDRQPVGPEQGFRAVRPESFDQISYDGESEVLPGETQWQRFRAYLGRLNQEATPSPQFKVLLVGRHGEGVHNVKERQVGRAEWERYWSRLESDSETSWLDARLTDRGRQQATALAHFWQDGIANANIPLPESFYTSPLARCLETARLTYSKLPCSNSHFHPAVTEAIREIIGIHTCDKRSSKSWIQSKFPEAVFNSSFTEVDELWKSDRRETLEERVPVLREFLEHLFDNDNATFVSLTTHSGAIRALHLAVGHPDVWVAAGAIVPIVVWREREPSSGQTLKS